MWLKKKRKKQNHHHHRRHHDHDVHLHFYLEIASASCQGHERFDSTLAIPTMVREMPLFWLFWGKGQEWGDKLPWKFSGKSWALSFFWGAMAQRLPFKVILWYERHILHPTVHTTSHHPREEHHVWFSVKVNNHVLRAHVPMHPTVPLQLFL